MGKGAPKQGEFSLAYLRHVFSCCYWISNECFRAKKIFFAPLFYPISNTKMLLGTVISAFYEGNPGKCYKVYNIIISRNNNDASRLKTFKRKSCEDTGSFFQGEQVAHLATCMVINLLQSHLHHCLNRYFLIFSSIPVSCLSKLENRQHGSALAWAFAWPIYKMPARSSTYLRL